MELSIHAAAGKALVPFLQQHLPRVAPLLRPRLREVSIALVGDAKMSALHERFLQIAGPTDVLTFPLETDPLGRVRSGEIVICVPHARRAASRQGVSLPQEVLLYAVHGMLHLTGYDDLNDDDYQRMHAREDAILTALGIGPVFEVGR